MAEMECTGSKMGGRVYGVLLGGAGGDLGMLGGLGVRGGRV